MSQLELDDDILGHIARFIRERPEIQYTDLEEIIEGYDDLKKILHEHCSAAGRTSGTEQDINEQQLVREEIVSTLEKRFGVHIPYQRLKRESQYLAEGSHVRIREDSRYCAQNDGIGTMLNDFGSECIDSEGAWARVVFDNGYSNTYRECDLEPILDKHTIREIQKYNESVLERTAQTSFDEFKKEMMASLIKLLEDDKIIICTESENGFSVGDMIMMTEKADHTYRYSKAGSTGVIVRELLFGKYDVKFSKLTSGAPVPKTCDVHKDFMALRKNLKEIIPEGQSPEDYFDSTIKEIKETVISERRDKKLTKGTRDMLAELLISTGLVRKERRRLFVNHGETFGYVAKKLTEIYSDNSLYSSPDMFSPPSERQPYVLRLELTTGCNYGRCTFCEGYKDIPFYEKDHDEFMAYYKKVLQMLGDYKEDVRRLFIGGGNALASSQDTLVRVIDRIRKDFRPRRISIYGRADTIVKKGSSGLRPLIINGLDLIYWGIESGADPVLRYINKGTSRKQMEDAAEICNRSGIDLSVMIMPGLGGIRHYDAHIAETASLLNSINPRYVTFMAVNPGPKSMYARKMKVETADGSNRPLTGYETVSQVKEMLYLMKPNGQKIGMFGCDIDQVGNNPVSFNVRFNEGGKRDAIRACDDYLLRNLKKVGSPLGLYL